MGNKVRPASRVNSNRIAHDHSPQCWPKPTRANSPIQPVRVQCSSRPTLQAHGWLPDVHRETLRGMYASSERRPRPSCSSRAAFSLLQGRYARRRALELLFRMRCQAVAGEHGFQVSVGFRLFPIISTVMMASGTAARMRDIFRKVITI